MFILCPKTQAIYNADRITRYFVDTLNEEDKEVSMANSDEHWVIIGDTDVCSYHLGYYRTEEEANDAICDMMTQIKINDKWVMLNS